MDWEKSRSFVVVCWVRLMVSLWRIVDDLVERIIRQVMTNRDEACRILETIERQLLLRVE